MLNLSEHNKVKPDTDADLSSLKRSNPNLDGIRPLRMLKWLALIVLLCLFLPWTQNIQTEGNVTALLPQQRPQAVVSLIEGRIDSWKVMEGQYVKAGDTLVTISEIKDEYFDTAFVMRAGEQLDAKERSLISYNAKGTALEAQIINLGSLLEVKTLQAKNKIRQAGMKYASDSLELQAEKARYDIALIQVERWRELYRQGLKSKTELEQRELKFRETSASWQSAINQLDISKNELINARAELNSINADYQEKINKARSELATALATANETEGEVSKLKNRYAGYKVRRGFHAITAPQTGFIARALRNGIGETVKAGDQLFSIVPGTSSPAVELFITATDLPLVRKGEKVRLVFDGWPAFVFSGWPGVSMGTFGGRVVAVDNFSDGQGRFRILIAPDQNEKKWPELVRPGSGAHGILLLNDVMLGYEIWRKLNGFPPEFYKKDDQVKEKK
jgi:multidrug resistance efflux pump